MTKQEDKTNIKPKKSLFSAFFSRPERDETFREDLGKEWKDLNKGERVKFVLGAIIGLLLFLGSLWLVYWVMKMILSY